MFCLCLDEQAQFNGRDLLYQTFLHPSQLSCTFQVEKKCSKQEGVITNN